MNAEQKKKLEVGQHVSIVREQLVYSSRLGKEIIQLKQVPGIVREVLPGDRYIVAFYGPPGHFMTKKLRKRGFQFSVYRENVHRDSLIRRKPEIDDPMEFI